VSRRSLACGGHHQTVLDRKTCAQPPAGRAAALIPAQSPQKALKSLIDCKNGQVQGFPHEQQREPIKIERFKALKDFSGEACNK